MNKEQNQAISDAKWWKKFGKLFGWTLYGFSFRQTATFYDKHDNAIRLTGSQKQDIEDGIMNLKELRTAVANYMRSEGCSCCEASDHAEHKAVLAKLLKIPKYKDNSGYNFGLFERKINENTKLET